LGTTELRQWRLEDAAYVDGLVTDDDGPNDDDDDDGHGHDDNDCHGHDDDDGDVIGDSYEGYVVMML